MKRFFTVSGFSLVFSLLLLNRIFPSHATVFLIASAVCCAALFFIKKLKIRREIICVFASFVLSAVIFIFHSENVYKPQLELAGERFDIEATVIDCPSVSSSGNFSYLIRTKKIGDSGKSIKMRLYTPYDICAGPYDTVRFSSKPFVLGENSESMLEYFKAKGTYLGAYTSDDVLIYEPSGKSPVSLFFLQKLKSENTIRKYLPGDNAEFAISLLLGDKTRLSDELKDAFSVSGLSHIMAVSGLHMSVWVAGLYYVLKKLGADSRLSSAVCILSAWCLVFFCGFSVSVVRAAIMATVYFSASFFKRKSDALNSLGAAAFIICLLNPFAVSDVSFLLSFFAALGIIVCTSFFSGLFNAEKKQRIDKRILRYALCAFGVSAAAGIFTAPVLIRYFSSLSIYSVIGNIFVSFAVAPCLLLSGVLSLCPDHYLAYPVKQLLVLTEKYIFSVVRLTNALPFAKLSPPGDAFHLYLPLLLISLIFIIYCVRKNKITVSAVLCAFSMIIVCVS